MKYYILLALAFVGITESYLNVPLLNLRKTKTTSLCLSKKKLMDNNQKGLLGMFNIFSGGAISRMAIFSLGIIH